MAAPRFLKQARNEVFQAYDWYETQAEGLGNDLVAELDTGLEAVQALPEAWPRFGNSARRYLLARFPYSIVYLPDTRPVTIVAFMHQSRLPGYWQNRLK